MPGPASEEVPVVTALGQFCSSGGTCAHLSGLGDSLSAPRASFACSSLFAWTFFTLGLQRSVDYLNSCCFGEKLPISPSPLLLLSHLGTWGGNMAAFFPPFLDVFVLENRSASRVILPFLKILSVFSACACLKLSCTKWYFYRF